MANKKVKNVVVLGAGVMGGQIAALLACTGHKVRLLDLPLAGDEAGRARQGLEKALASRPPLSIYRRWPSASSWEAWRI